MKLLALYLDAWPYRYIDMLLKKVKEVDPNVGYAKLIPVFGYTDCFKVSLLTGLYPDEHRYWVSYVFSNSPEPRPIPKVLSCFLDMDVLPVRGLRFVLSKFTGIHMFHVRTWNNIVEQGVNPESPFVEIDNYLRANGFGTLFGGLESRAIRYAVLEDRFYRHRLDMFAKVVAKNMEHNDVVFAYIDEPDFWGHKYGVEDPQYIGLLKWLAGIVKHLIKLAISRGFGYVVFSDHGMATVEEYIDLYHYISRDPSYGRTYVAGIDATFFRVFYLNSSRENSPTLSKIKRLLRSKAFLLEEEDFRKYRLPMDRCYGDEVYALREGIVLYPNFFSWLKPKGMHAYSPDYSNQHGIVLASKDVMGDKGIDIDVPKLYELIKGGLT